MNNEYKEMKVDEFVNSVINVNYKLGEYFKKHGKELNKGWYNFIANLYKIIDYEIFMYEEDDYE